MSAVRRALHERHDDPAMDGPRLVSGASRGFTILALGGVVQPLVGAALPLLGFYWLVLVALAAFVAAARRGCGVSKPVRQGAAAALGSYLLMLPVVHMATGELIPVQVACTAVLAVVTGAVTGWASGRALRASTAAGSNGR